MIEMFVNEIIEFTDNSAGTLLNRNAISIVVNSLIENRNLSKKNIDKLIFENESDNGYMIKANDFIYVLYPYIIGDNLQYNDLPEKPEKDLEIIELMYNEWHSECGCRD